MKVVVVPGEREREKEREREREREREALCFYFNVCDLCVSCWLLDANWAFSESASSSTAS